MAHTVRGAVDGASSKKRGLEVASENETGGRADPIAGGALLPDSNQVRSVMKRCVVDVR